MRCDDVGGGGRWRERGFLERELGHMHWNDQACLPIGSASPQVIYPFHQPQVIYPFLPKNHGNACFFRAGMTIHGHGGPVDFKLYFFFLPQDPFFNQNLRWQTNAVNTELSLSSWGLGMAQSEAPWSAALVFTLQGNWSPEQWPALPNGPGAISDRAKTTPLS